jgi:homoserine O-acetyltransferase
MPEMTPLHAAAEAAHVEACCSTGSSPGVVVFHGTRTSTVEFQLHDPAPVTVSYSVSGPATAPPVLVLGGISANRHVASWEGSPWPAWWPGVAGPGSVLDPRRHRLIGLDWLGGAEGGGRLPGPVTPRDQARAAAAVLDHLGIARVSLVGASYGGMVALAFASLFPHRTLRSVILCAAHRAHPMATAVRSIQRDIVRLSAGTAREADAVALARGLAMTTYRSADEFEQRFHWAAEEGSGPAPRFPVESYLRQRGESFARRFPAEAYLRLSESIDLHSVDPATIVTDTTLVSVDSDVLAPPWLVDELARNAPGVTRHHRLSSPFGHDAFLKETAAVSAILDEALSGEVAR